MRLKTKDKPIIEIEVQRVVGPPDEPFGRDMHTAQQYVDESDGRYTYFTWVKVVRVIVEPPEDDEDYLCPIHNEVVEACKDGQPVLAFTTKDGKVVLEFGDFGEAFEIVERTAHNIEFEADDLWTEWRVTNQGDPMVDAQPADPPALGDEIAWADCLAWYNTEDLYSLMTDEQLAEAVVEQRLSVSFGDGLERDYAQAGGCSIGDPVDEMSRKDMIDELTGYGNMPKPCDHEHSHEIDHGDGQRFCNGCGEHFTPTDYGAEHLERWRLADEFSYLVADGRSAEFAQQVREMLDTRTIEQLRILTGRSPTITMPEPVGGES